MNHRSKLLFIVILSLLYLYGCSKDETNPVQPQINEAELLIQELEGAKGDYLNTACPAITSAQVVNEDITLNKSILVLDIRAAADFTKGHIKGAVNVVDKEVLTYLKTNNASQYEKVVIVCYTGQTAAWVTAIARMSGYTNVSSMKYGMSSWHQDFDKVTANCSSQYATQFTDAESSKPVVGNLPALSTGKTNGAEILEAQIAKINNEGFATVAINAVDVFLDPSKYFIVNYWPMADYTSLKHIIGAMQYTPKVDLKLSTLLKTLPTNKTIVVYCYTGQTSSNVATILKTIGYDAKTLKFGTNALIWDSMKAAGKTHFEAANDCMNFPYVQ